MDTYKTSIVAIKFKSSIVFVIDSRMTLIDYSDVASNTSQKIVEINSGAADLNKNRYAFVCFAGDIPLLRELKKTLPVDPALKANLTVTEVTNRIMNRIPSIIRKDKVFYGIVVVGIGEGDTLQMNLISTVHWTKEELNNHPDSKRFKMKLVLEQNVQDICVAGTGAKWLKTFFRERYYTGTNWEGDNSFKMGRQVLNIPLDMSPKDAENLAMEALVYAVHRNVGTGGMLHGFRFTKEADANGNYGGFRVFPFYRKPEDYYYCKSELIPWLNPNEPPVFDVDDDDDDDDDEERKRNDDDEDEDDEERKRKRKRND